MMEQTRPAIGGASWTPLTQTSLPLHALEVSPLPLAACKISTLCVVAHSFIACKGKQAG